MRLADRLSSIPTATGGIARLTHDRLRDAGIDPAPVLLAAGLSMEDVDDSKRRLDASVQVRVLDLAAEAVADDWFGFRLARDFDLGRIGLLYYVMASSDRLADALRNAERYCAINNEGVRLRFSSEGTFFIRFEYLKIDRLADRHHMEFWLVAVVRICRTLTSTRLAPKQIRVRHLRPRTPPEVRAYLGCEIEFGADRDEVSFPGPIGTLPISGADVHLNTLLLDYAGDALSSSRLRPSGLRSHVEDQIAQLLPHGKATASEVSRRLGMSRRTLVRALAAEGAAFSDLLEALRQALAKRYLREGTLPISEIAWLLGYREVSSFTHAFSRWTGSTPSGFRSSEHVR